MSFGDGNLHELVDELRELVRELVIRVQIVENATGVCVMDARFYKRIEEAGVEVEK